MKTPKFKKYNIYHKGLFIEVMNARNKKDAIWGTLSVNNGFKLKDMKAIEKIEEP